MTSILIEAFSSGSTAMTSTCTPRAMRSQIGICRTRPWPGARRGPRSRPRADRPDGWTGARQFSACALATATCHFPTPAGPAKSSVGGSVFLEMAPASRWVMRRWPTSDWNVICG